MTIISQNQTVKAGVAMHAGALHIDFTEDPSFIRSETVLVDLMQRSIGIVFQNGYHHIGNLPGDVSSGDLAKALSAKLQGSGEGGRRITLNAPVKIIKHNA